MTTTTQPDTLDFLGAGARVLASGEGYGLVHMEMPPGEMPPDTALRGRDLVALGVSGHRFGLPIPRRADAKRVEALVAEVHAWSLRYPVVILVAAPV